MKQSRSLPPVRLSLILVLMLLASLIVPILPTGASAQEPGATEAPVSTEPIEDLSPTDGPEQTAPDIVATEDPTNIATEEDAPATLPATEEPAPSVTEAPTLEPLATETEEPVAAFGLIEVGPLTIGDPMSFEGLVAVPPGFGCLTSDTVDVSLTVLNSDPTFQGVQIELFGSTLGTEVEVLQDAVVIASSEGDGFYTRTLTGNFSDTFDHWFVLVRLLDGAGITQQLSAVQIDLDCAPGPIKPGSPMSFTSFAIVPPTDCVTPGTVSASVLIHNADLTFQGLQVQLIGTTTAEETEVVQDTVLITPDQGSGAFNFTLTGDFGAIFRSWRVFVRLLDGSGITQQLTARSIELDCAPEPIKGDPKATETVVPSETVAPTETAIPGSPTSAPTGPVTFSNLEFDAVFDCSESTRMTGSVRLNTPVGPNEDVIVELLGFKPGISTPDLLDSTDIDSNQPAGIYDLVLFGDFTSTYSQWSVTVRSDPATIKLAHQIFPDCDGTPPTETIEPTEVPTEDPTEVPGTPITIDFGIDIPEQCGASLTLHGFITYANIPGRPRFASFSQSDLGVLVTLIDFDSFNNETVLDSEFVAFTDSSGEATFSLVTDILPPFVKWSITFDLVLFDSEPERLGASEFTISCPEPAETATTTPAATETVTAGPVYRGTALIDWTTGVVSSLPVTGTSPDNGVPTIPMAAVTLLASAFMLFVLAAALRRRHPD